MVHSSLSQIGHVVGGPHAVIDTLMEVVGANGTIMMPSYFSAEYAFEAYRRGEPVDLRTEKSKNGVITEVFRQRPDVHRSSHPFSPVCAWGEHAHYLTEAHHCGERVCHKDSPLARHTQLNGKTLGLGVSVAYLGVYHVVEDQFDGYPFDTSSPPAEIEYVDQSGNKVCRMVRRYDPGISRTRIDTDRGHWILDFMTKKLRKRMVLHEFKVGLANSFWVEGSVAYKELCGLATQGITIYMTQKEWGFSRK